MPIFSKNMPSLRQLRTLSTRTRLETGERTTSAILKSGPWKKNWPAREESVGAAAAQILGQKQPQRNWSNRPLDTGMFRPVSMPDQAYVSALPKRNTVAAAPSKHRSARTTLDHGMERMDRRRPRMVEAREDDEAQMESQQDHHQMDRRPEMSNEDRDSESDLEVRSVREIVFGPAEDNDEDDRLRAQADNDLLRRVATQNRYEPPVPSISQKVIQPYNSYRSHRTRWAEFRHGMIYGRAAF